MQQADALPAEVARERAGEPPWEVRRAREADAGAVAALTESAIAEAWCEEAVGRHLRSRTGRVWIAHGRDVAPAWGVLLADRILDELHLLVLAVAPAQRRRGLARRLLGAALADARAEGALARVDLEVRTSNRAARRLYRGAGFREVGRRRRYYADGEDAVLLTLLCRQVGRGA